MSRFIAALLLLPLAWGQRPEFEVASIKPSRPQEGPMRAGCLGGPPIDPTLVRCSNYPLRNFVMEAWGLAAWEYRGPDWMLDAMFDIQAKIPPGTTREQYRQMFQALYEHRFHLTYHQAPTQVDGYELVLAKGQPKAAGAMPKGFPDPPRRGISQNGPRRVMRYDGVTIAEVAQRLGFQLRAPVVDATGLEGTRDLLLYWVVDNPAPGDEDVAGPSFKEAVRSQLSWRLEPKKVDVSVFVVDHMDRIPTEN
jgi:uncharacterized protein (TIGR03435 family)